MSPNSRASSTPGQKVWRTIGHPKVLPHARARLTCDWRVCWRAVPIVETGLVRKSPGPRPAEGTTASRRRMLTAPTPLFSAPTRSSAILVEPRIDPVETGASLSGRTLIRICVGKRRCDSAHEAGTELAVARCCSIHQDDRISPQNNRPLRKPWRRPRPGFPFLCTAPSKHNRFGSSHAWTLHVTARDRYSDRRWEWRRTAYRTNDQPEFPLQAACSISGATCIGHNPLDPETSGRHHWHRFLCPTAFRLSVMTVS